MNDIEFNLFYFFLDREYRRWGVGFISLRIGERDYPLLSIGNTHPNHYLPDTLYWDVLGIRVARCKKRQESLDEENENGC